MFEIGDFVACGNNGICSVADITALDLTGIDKKRKYYLLKPVYQPTSTVYIPVDTADKAMRKAVTEKEAKELIHAIPDIPLISLSDERALEKTYKEYMGQNNCEAWVKLIKTIFLRKETRLSNGHKVTAVDSRYFKLAEEFLYAELAVALQITRDEVRDYITDTIDATGSKGSIEQQA